MRPSTLAALSGTTAGLAGAALAVIATRRSLIPISDRPILTLPEQLEYREVRPGVSMAIVRGHPERGPYAVFTRFQPGLYVPRHTHSSPISILVLKGAYIIRSDEGEIRVGAGSHLLLPADLPHDTRSDPAEGALFFQESVGKFDLNLLQ